jgi:inosine-uridine nucleoside N-ribohydrolase
MIRSAIFLFSCLVATTAAATTRIWIDTDPACGLGAVSDPDDCFALLHLLSSPSVEIAGISTTFGNASLAETTAVARELLRRSHRAVPPVHAGAEDAMYWWKPQPTAASRAIVAALEDGPLTLLALGPLTNLSASLAERPDLASRITRAIAVMGKEPGEIFHPAEGSPDALLGHGPAFSDLNFAKDPRAVKSVFDHRIPVTLVPYAAGKTQSISENDLAALAKRGGAAAWVADGSKAWLGFWRNVVGRDGFYPFDLVAAIVATEPSQAACVGEAVIVKHDDKIGWFGFGPRSLLFTRKDAPDALPVATCRAITGRAAERLIAEPHR